MKKQKELIIDPSDLCYEEEIEQITFGPVEELEGTVIASISFTNELS